MAPQSPTEAVPVSRQAAGADVVAGGAGVDAAGGIDVEIVADGEASVDVVSTATVGGATVLRALLRGGSGGGASGGAGCKGAGRGGAGAGATGLTTTRG